MFSEATFKYHELDDNIDEVGIKNIKNIYMNEENLKAQNNLLMNTIRMDMMEMSAPTEEDFEQFNQHFANNKNKYRGVDILVDDNEPAFRFDL